MRPIEKASEDLFQKLRSRFSPITLGNETAENTADPKEARIFNFMYKEGNNDIGYVSISLTDSRVLKVYYGSDLLDNLRDKTSWYNLLRDLRSFSKRNLLSFDARDLAKNQLEPRDFKFISQQDGSYKDHEVEVTESVMFGSRRKSYQTVESVKMIVNHRKSIDETIPGSRSRYIESIFIENADGERFKFPFNYLTGARAMTRHVAEGGTPYDNVGKHILETITEMRNLSKFARRTKKYAMENAEAGNVRQSVIERFQGLKKTLSAMSVKEGYTRFVENFSTEEALAEDDSVQQLKERFTQQVFDAQLEDTLPSVIRAIKEAEMRQVSEADNSVEKIVKDKNWLLVLRKDDAADNLFKATKFTDGAGLLGFILSDIAGRAIGDGADVVANFASDAAERMQDREYNANDKQLAMLLAKKYMDDVKKMAADSSYAAMVRMDPSTVYGAKKKRDGGFHEAEAFESWASELVPEGQINELSPELADRAKAGAFKKSAELGREGEKTWTRQHWKHLHKPGYQEKLDKANDLSRKSNVKLGQAMKFSKYADDKRMAAEDYEKDAADASKKYGEYARHEKAQSKSNSLAAQLSPTYRREMDDRSKQSSKLSKKYANKALTGMDDKELPESSFYRDNERTGSAEGAKRAILWRIQNQHLDLIKQYGLDKVLQMVDDEAMYLDNLEEIGSSDISAWVNNIKRNLAADWPDLAGDDKKKVGEDWDHVAKQSADNADLLHTFQNKVGKITNNPDVKKNAEYWKKQSDIRKKQAVTGMDDVDEAFLGGEKRRGQENPNNVLSAAKPNASRRATDAYDKNISKWKGQVMHPKGADSKKLGRIDHAIDAAYKVGAVDKNRMFTQIAKANKKSGNDSDKDMSDPRKMFLPAPDAKDRALAMASESKKSKDTKINKAMKSDKDFEKLSQKEQDEVNRKLRMSEDQVDELKQSTLKSYGRKAMGQIDDLEGIETSRGGLTPKQKLKLKKRDKGIEMVSKKIDESQLNENWDDKDHYRFEDFKKALEAKGYQIKGIMHWGYSDWRSSGDEAPHAELTVVDKNGREGSVYWPKGAKKKYFTAQTTDEATLGGDKYVGKANPNNKTKFLKKMMGYNKNEKVARATTNHSDQRTRADYALNHPEAPIWNKMENPKHSSKRHSQALQAAGRLESKTNEATTQGTIGTTGTQGTSAAPNQSQLMRDPKLQQGAKNVSRVAQAAGINAPPQQIAQGMAAQAAGKQPSRQAMQTLGGLGNTIMQAAANDPQKAAQLTAMMKKMVGDKKFNEDAIRSILMPTKK